jgi:hypothetical protein
MPQRPPEHVTDAPISDEEAMKLVRQSHANGCDELLRRLICHHPQHERPGGHSRPRDDDPVRHREE